MSENKFQLSNDQCQDNKISKATTYQMFLLFAGLGMAFINWFKHGIKLNNFQRGNLD